jgi:hypothetical protein
VVAQKDVGVETQRLESAADEAHLGARSLAEEVVDPSAVRVGEARDLVQREHGVRREVDGAEALGRTDPLVAEFAGVRWVASLSRCNFAGPRFPVAVSLCGDHLLSDRPLYSLA